MAVITSVKIKTVSFEEMREHAAEQAAISGTVPHMLTDDSGEILKGMVLDYKVRVRTVEGIAESRYVFISREETFKVTTVCGKIIECTGSHKLLLDQEKDIWCETKDLRPGNLIRLAEGYAEIQSIEPAGRHAVADICVPGPHSYLLDNGIVSHNSLLANHLCINVASAGYKVLIVPLEMSKKEMLGRLLANRSKLDVTRILQHRLATGERDLAYKKYELWAKRVRAKGGRLTIFKPEEDMSIEDLFAAISSYDSDMVIIDYISLLKGADGDDSWQKLGAIARCAKINAESSHRSNVLLCQVNDEGKIRYARAISEHSNNSWIWVTKKEEREKEVGRIRVEQPKARNSKSFPFEIGFEWAHMRVVPIEGLADVGSVPEPMTNLADV